MNFFRIFAKKGTALLFPLFLFFLFVFITPAKAEKAPLFSLPSATDGAIVNMKDYLGKVVVVNFFTTWCPPCRQEIPSLNSLHEEYGPKGFSVIGISLDEGSSKIVAKFINKMEIIYPVLMADGNVTRDFGGVIGIPTSFLVDQKGEVAKRYNGYVPHDLLKKDIDELLKTP